MITSYKNQALTKSKLTYMITSYKNQPLTKSGANLRSPATKKSAANKIKS
jgi:hypothetical protein